VKRVRFRKEVAPELTAARAWYEDRHEGLGDDFLQTIRNLVTRASRVPLEFPVVHRDIRRALARRFPYAVYFRVVDDGILVVAVQRQSAHPRRWRSRG